MNTRLAVLPSVILSVGTISTLLLAVGLQWGFAAEEESVDLHGWVHDEAGTAVTRLPVRCTGQDSQQKTIDRVLFPKEETGAFTLPIPRSVETITCKVGPDPLGMFEDASKENIPVAANNSIAFMLNYRPIQKLEGQIIVPKGWKVDNAWIEITQNKKTISYSAPRDEQGVQGEKFPLDPLGLKAGPATVKYRATGLGSDADEPNLIDGSTLVRSLPFDRFPYALLLLIPGIVILGLRAGLEWLWRWKEWGYRNLGLLLIIIALVLWGGTFLALWWMLGEEGTNTLHFFHPNLSFSLAIPIFGFLGSLLFVIDVFQSRTPTDLSSDRTEKLNLNASMEFVLRLVLGPYVAIVMVLLFRDTFSFIRGSEELGAQATVAFFSGFLVTLFLQSLSEKGNELLGEWRSSTRYDPSQIARELNLAQEEDLKLRRVNLKYLGHLQQLSDEDIVQMAKQSELSEGLLLSLRDQAKARRKRDVPELAQQLRERIGTAVWAKLQEEKIESVGDLAARTPAEIPQIAQRQSIDPDILTKHSDDAKALVKAPWF
jgi:hypothetical protein